MDERPQCQAVLQVECRKTSCPVGSITAWKPTSHRHSTRCDADAAHFTLISTKRGAALRLVCSEHRENPGRVAGYAGEPFPPDDLPPLDQEWQGVQHKAYLFWQYENLLADVDAQVDALERDMRLAKKWASVVRDQFTRLYPDHAATARATLGAGTRR